MTGWLGNAYVWVKAAHIIFVIFWMAGLFMLPRFFVYHQEAEIDSPENALWIEREKRIISIILNPAMVIVWILGLGLALDIEAFHQSWFYLKLLAVFGLSGYHGWMIGYAKKLARGERALDGRKLRMLNEVPGVAAAIIVVLVIVKPFM
jgi:protoporphyrinogen IX oxidase